MNIQDKLISTCIFCDESVFRSQDYFSLPIERPVRIDLLVHKKCYKLYRNNGELKDFLQENLLDYLDKYDEDYDGKEKKNNRKKQRDYS